MGQAGTSMDKSGQAWTSGTSMDKWDKSGQAWTSGTSADKWISWKQVNKLITSKHVGNVPKGIIAHLFGIVQRARFTASSLSRWVVGV